MTGSPPSTVSPEEPAGIESLLAEQLIGGDGKATDVSGLISAAQISAKRAIWNQSKSFQHLPPKNMALEDQDSPRFQEILRLTNAQPEHKKKPQYKKSQSLDPSYKGACSKVEDVKLMIKDKFNEAKGEVNIELAIFAGELLTTLDQYKEPHPEWKNEVEDLLIIAHKSAQMPAEEFWSKCEGIVLDLDDRRKEVPIGVIKQAYTRLLFILTRCTRIVQCQ